MFFEARRSINTPDEANKIRENVLYQQTHWLVDDNYKHFVPDDETAN